MVGPFSLLHLATGLFFSESLGRLGAYSDRPLVESFTSKDHASEVNLDNGGALVESAVEEHALTPLDEEPTTAQDIEETHEVPTTAQDLEDRTDDWSSDEERSSVTPKPGDKESENGYSYDESLAKEKLSYPSMNAIYAKMMETAEHFAKHVPGDLTATGNSALQASKKYDESLTHLKEGFTGFADSVVAFRAVVQKEQKEDANAIESEITKEVRDGDASSQDKGEIPETTNGTELPEELPQEVGSTEKPV